MTAAAYEDVMARAQELRERLERMRNWFDQNERDADPEELGWRRERFYTAEREYDELLQIIRSYGKAPVVGGASRAVDGGFAPLEE